jgi:hypothetical protein
MFTVKCVTIGEIRKSYKMDDARSGFLRFKFKDLRQGTGNEEAILRHRRPSLRYRPERGMWSTSGFEIQVRPYERLNGMAGEEGTK